MRQLLGPLLRLARTPKGRIALGVISCLLVVGVTMSKVTAQNSGQGGITEGIAAQINVLVQEKQSRTPAQQKISSSILHGIKIRRGDKLMSRVPTLKSSLNVTDNKVRLDIKTRVPVTTGVVEKIQATGAEVLSAFPDYDAVQVLIGLDQVESLAELPEVLSVQPYIEPQLSRGSISTGNVSPSLVAQGLTGAELPITNVGKVTSEGDIAHGAAIARSIYGVNGTGIKVGVLSDSYNNLGGAATDMATGDLPLDGVTLVGSGEPKYVKRTDEGRAMLQIIHDLAPGAKLFFATADNSEADFANNIIALRRAGCDIIVDDYFYYTEPVFQDGIVAQAVNTVTADGALYFSSAGNSGNFKDGTSGVWQGDFVDGGSAAGIGRLGRIHTFGSTSSDVFNTVKQQDKPITLHWSDPVGQSTNDYDLFVFNPSMKIIDASTNIQSGYGSNPFEKVGPQPFGSLVAIVKYSGEPRFLHLNTNRGQLKINTPGQTSGHSAAVNAFSVAAVKAQGRTTIFTGGAANPVEDFSSDGRRIIFYNADSTPVTPGNFLSSGGVLRQKPDIAAADGVVTTLPSGGGLNPFFGTSAAAPHAAAVAALLKSFKPGLTPEQVRNILTTTALDIEDPGVDRTSGYGIVMANLALQQAAR